MQREGRLFLGGLIISIARVLGLEEKFSQLTPLPHHAIDIDMTRIMKLVKWRRVGKFNLIIENNVLHDFILPNPTRTDVRNQEIFCHVKGLVPAHISENVASGGDTEEDYIPEQAAPTTDPHTIHMPSENVTGTSSSQRPRRRNVAPSTIDEIYSELLWRSELDAQRDLQIENMEAQEIEMLQILPQMQHDQHDYAFRTEQNMFVLIDELTTLTVRMEDLQDYAPPHQSVNGARVRTHGRRRQ